MFRATLLLVLSLVVSLAAGGPAAAQPTEDFVAELLSTVGAQSVRCSRDVRAAVRSRQMVAVCARFAGDFTAFREVWTARLDLDAGRFPGASARTGWERRDDTFERIYSVGETALGIRFSDGDLMLVFPE